MTAIYSFIFSKSKKRSVVSAFFCFLLLVLSSCGKDTAHTLLIEGPTMGTQYHIKVVATDANHKSEEFQNTLKSLVTDKLVAINQSMSTYIDDSELSLINQAPIDEWINLSPDLFELLMLCNKVSVESDGAFDTTVGPLVNLWGFGPSKTEVIPSQHQINDLLVRIGYQKIILDAVKDTNTGQIKKSSDLYIDLSSAAKGFAADLLAREFRALNLQNFMIEVGGELYVSGTNAQGKSWTIGVEKPSLLHDGSLQAIHVSNVGIATSGEYRNYYEVDGVRASHTIDPSIGKPIHHKLVSVTVISEMGALSDAYATALNVMGPEKGFLLAEKLELAAYFIVKSDDGFVTKYTPSFKPYLE